MNIREIVESTSQVIATYKYPSTSEFREAINPILKAAGLECLGSGDQIDSVDIDDDELRIDYSWVRMQCESSNEIRIPTAILDAKDPIAEANAWRLDQAVSRAQASYDEAERNFKARTQALEKAKSDRGDTAPQPLSAPAGSEQDIAAMVNRFLGWPLPKTFGPDCGISFDGRKDDEWNKNKPWPIGTNLLTAVEAKAMLLHCLGGAK